MHDLEVSTGGDGPFDADRGGVAELDGDGEVVGESLLDDLLLHLAVEREERLLVGIVLPEIDQRILFGELQESHMEGATITRAQRHDHCLECGRSEVVGSGGCARYANGVADLDLAEPPELADSPAASDPRCTTAPRSNRAYGGDFRWPGPQPATTRVRTTPENMRV